MSQPTETAPAPVRHDVSLLTENDLYLFNEGSHYRIHDKMGAHPMDAGGELGASHAGLADVEEDEIGVGTLDGDTGDLLSLIHI